MKKTIAIPVGMLLLACSAGVFAGPQNPASGQKQQSAAGKSTNGKEGALRFRANCGRCHNAPESLSPREAKAVLQHMRVRALLSEEDEQLILKYIAP
jgi:cytochrome c5